MSLFLKPSALCLTIASIILWPQAAAWAEAPIKTPRSANIEQAVESGKASPLAMKTEEVIIFKDGYALIKKTGRGVLDAQGQLHIQEVPEAAVLGTFWATPTKGRLLAMTAGETSFNSLVSEEKICESTAEMVAANVGRECELVLHGNGEKEIRLQGRIKELLLPSLEAGPAASLVSPEPEPAGAVAFDEEMSNLSLRSLESRMRPTSSSAAPANPNAGWQIGENPREAKEVFDFILETESGDVVLNTRQIAMLAGKDLNTKLVWKKHVQKKGKQLTLNLDGRPGEQRDVVLLYFSPGIRWIPTYQVELSSDGKSEPTAKMRLQGEILNELEDLEGVKTQLVVGVPHFRFREIISPLSLEKQLQNALMGAAPQLMGAGNRSRNNEQLMMNNALMSQSSFAGNQDFSDPQEAGSGGQADLSMNLSGDGAQDMFFYTIPSLSVKRHARAAVNLLDATVPYKEVYVWNVHIKRAHQQSRNNSAAQQDQMSFKTNDVWRTLELSNVSDIPWTTGPVFFMQDGRPIAQEMLTYTPAGGKTRCPLTAAIDVRGNWLEKETGRKLNALEWNDHQYTLIGMEAAFSIHNAKKTPVDIELTVTAGGEAGKAEPAAEISHGNYNPNDWYGDWQAMAINKQAKVLWRFTVPAGGKFAPLLNYRYFWY